MIPVRQNGWFNDALWLLYPQCFAICSKTELPVQLFRYHGAVTSMRSQLWFPLQLYHWHRFVVKKTHIRKPWLVNEAIYLVGMLNSTSKQQQSHSSSPLVIDLSDQMVKTSGIRATEHQASNTVCPGDMERRERGRGGGGGKEGENGWLATVKWDSGAVSKADSVWLSQASSVSWRASVSCWSWGRLTLEQKLPLQVVAVPTQILLQWTQIQTSTGGTLGFRPKHAGQILDGGDVSQPAVISQVS